VRLNLGSPSLADYDVRWAQTARLDRTLIDYLLMIQQLLVNWLSQAVASGASDLHIVVGHQPTLRVHGELRPLDADVLTRETAAAALLPFCPERARERFDRERNADFAIEVDVGGRPERFRVNYFVNGENPGGCFRWIPRQIPDFEWAGFPRNLADRLAHFRNGLVLITGMTGAGKTTTLAMIINLLNQLGGYRIVTIEDPIEYVFPTLGNSIVSQREVGRDVASFADGLKYGLRQDPDVMLVGEIRDYETAQMALSAAETGHLVFSTLHTRDVKNAISRFTDLFPQNSQSEVRGQLSLSLRSIIAQHLLPNVNGGKRVLALEIMFNNSPMVSAIRFGKLDTIDTNITTGRAEGMISLDESVRRLLAADQIDIDTAERYVSDKRVLLR
jgi:twitching motility protein PilT